MYMIASLDCRFKTNQKNIENVLRHYGLRKIQSSLYAGDLSNCERNDLSENISQITRENDSMLIIPICEKCYAKKQTSGREIKFQNDLYRVY